MELLPSGKLGRYEILSYTHRMRRVLIPLAVAMVLVAQQGRVAPFTAAQVATGGAAYRASCASCHGADLAGSANAPTLVGGLFLGGWGDKTAAQLVTFLEGSMPPANPG